jgi:hypothetical protein
MAALFSTPTHHELPSCGICGCDDVDVDYVEDSFLLREGTAYALELGECPRCDHRWTRPLRLPTRREAQNAAAARVLHAPADSIPNAA